MVPDTVQAWCMSTTPAEQQGHHTMLLTAFLPQPRSGITFQRTRREESVPAPRLKEEEGAVGCCMAARHTAAAWVPATGRRSKFMSQLRVNSCGLKHIATLQ